MKEAKKELKPQHTPGPWVTLKNGQSIQVNTVKTHHVNAMTLSGADLSGQRVDIIARVMNGPSGLSEGSGEANARLIAAAPDLLRELKAQPCFSCGTRLDEGCSCITSESARAAIAKAEGE